MRRDSVVWVRRVRRVRVRRVRGRRRGGMFWVRVWRGCWIEEGMVREESMAGAGSMLR